MWSHLVMKPKRWHRPLAGASATAVLLALTACGGGGGNGVPPPNDIGTLAYVVTECRDTADGFLESQALHISHGDRDVTVMETPGVGPISGLGGLCRALTSFRGGDTSISRDAFQGLAVSAEGAAVVFEVTDDFSAFPKLPLHLAPEQKGIFFVRADGSGLHRLGPPSRLPFFILSNGFTDLLRSFSFSLDGRLISFADTGPGRPDGQDAAQVFTLDAETGQRTQVTHLPPGIPSAEYPSDAPGVLGPTFIDSQTIGFLTDANPDGLNNTHNFYPFTVRTDGSDQMASAFPVAVAGSQIVPAFEITGDKPFATTLSVPGQPQNETPGQSFSIGEVFVIDGKNELQLTNFQRVDTGNATVDADRQTIFFLASADPLGTNPSKNCQVFSVDRIGGDMRQLTQFGEAPHSMNGCYFGRRGTGCVVYKLSQDSRTRRLIFYSSCDPLGTNPLGAQVFAMRPDGSELRQLTHTRGLMTEADGTFIGELPGPIAYGPHSP